MYLPFKSKHTLEWINDIAILVETLKNSTQVVLILISTRAGDQENVDVQVSISKRKAMKNLVAKALKSLRGTAKTKSYL